MMRVHPMDPDGYWVLPSGELVPLYEHTHVEYIEEFPEQFRIDELPDDTLKLFPMAIRNGAIRLTLDYDTGSGYAERLAAEMDTSRPMNLIRLADALQEIGFTEGELWIEDPFRPRRRGEAAAPCDVIVRAEDFIARPKIDWTRALVPNPYPELEESLVWSGNPVVPKVSKYEGMTVQYTNTRKKLRQWGQITSGARMLDFAVEMDMMDEVRERLYAVYTNIKYRPLGYRLIGAGSRTGAMVDPTVVFGPAVALQASCLFMVHNHPSGGREFSSDDRAMTYNLKKGAEILGIKLIDHVLVTWSAQTGAPVHLSMVEEGLI